MTSVVDGRKLCVGDIRFGRGDSRPALAMSASGRKRPVRLLIFTTIERPLWMKADIRGLGRNYSQSDSDNTSALPPEPDIGLN